MPSLIAVRRGDCVGGIVRAGAGGPRAETGRQAWGRRRVCRPVRASVFLAPVQVSETGGEPVPGFRPRRRRRAQGRGRR